MFERRKSRIRRFLVLILVGTAGLVGTVELLNSDLMLNSKSYEIVGYSEETRDPLTDGSTRIVKTKRFGFLPGQERIVFVHDEFGRTIDRQPLDGTAAAQEQILPTVELPVVTGERL